MRTRPSFGVILALLILGALGFSFGSMREIRESLGSVMTGAFWQGTDSSGRILEKEQVRYPPLKPGETLHVLEEGGKDLFFRWFAFTAKRETKSASIEVRFEDTQGRSIIVEVAPKSRGGIRLAIEGKRGQRVQVARKVDQDYLGDLSQPVAVKLWMGDRKFAVEINGKELIQTREILRSGGAFSLSAKSGPSRFMRLEVEAVERNGSGRVQVKNFNQDFAALPLQSGWFRIPGLLVRACLVLVSLFLLLRSFCRGRPGVKNLIRAEMLLLAPSSLYFATGLLQEISLHSLFLLILVPAGLILALFSLRDHLRTDTPLRRSERIRACLVSAVLITLIGYAAGTYGTRLHEKAVEAERTAQEPGNPLAMVRSERKRLDLNNAWTIDQTYRNMVLKTKVVLEEGAIFQLRLRAINPTWPQGISLFLSADSRFETRFFLESRKTFKAIGKGSGALPSMRVLNLMIEARGRHFDARVNGRRVASADERLFAGGGVVLLAAKGAARVMGLEIKPIELQEIRASLFPDQVLWALPPLAFLLFFALLASLFMHGSFWLILETSALASLPLVYCFRIASPAGPLDAPLIGWSLFMAASLFIAYLAVRSHTLTKLKHVILVVVILSGCVWAAAGLKERAWPSDPESIDWMTIVDWCGDRLDEDFLHFQHPLFRRWNGYLAQHKLRERGYPLKKKTGTVRILALGSSSTYGYKVKIPYPHHLEKSLLAEGFDVRVMNGAVQGANGVRQYYFLKNVLLGFSPDIVTLSLFNNDLVHLLQMDEISYIEKVTDPSYERSFIDSLCDRFEVWTNTYFQGHIKENADQSGEAVLLDRGPESLHVRFEAVLESFAVLSKKHDIRLVLIKEPVTGGMKNAGVKEFNDAMDRVGRKFGIPVVDPARFLNSRGGARLFIDRVHPTEEGHAVMAEALLPVIRSLLSK